MNLDRIVREPKTDFTGLAPSIPEDLYHLIKKAVSVRKHLERNRGDKDAKLYVHLFAHQVRLVLMDLAE